MLDYLLLLFLLLVGWFLKRFLIPEVKGKLGEDTVAQILNRLSKRQYKVIHDVNLYNKGYLSQIDHIVVSNYGVFVIETKNFKGWILGGEHSRYWTQVIFRRKFEFYNPILQNYGHVKSLRHHLSDYPFIKYVPVVVFTRRATLKIKTSSTVIYTKELRRTIRRHKEVVLTDAIKDEIFEIINSKNGKKDKATRRRTTRKSEVTWCPSCFGFLVTRTGKYGPFLGCNNFPKCSYTRPIHEQ